MIKIINAVMKRKLLVNLVMLLILFTGFTVILNINREAIPEVNFDMLSVTTVYPGAPPDDIEQLITIPLEKRLREVDGLDKVRSYNIENVSVIVVYIDDKASDKKQVVQDIKDAIELEDNLPDKAEKPIVEEIKTDKTRVIDLAITGKKGKTPYRTLRQTADEMEDRLYDISGVAEVEYLGKEDREYLVEVDPGALQTYRIGINKVINTLKMRNMDIPGGALRLGNKEYILRTKGKYNNAEEVRQTPLMVNDAGFVTRIGDIGRVRDTFQEPKKYQRINGRRAIILRIWKKKSADEIRLADKLRGLIGSYQPAHAKEVNLFLFNDQSRMTRARLSSLVVNAITGFILLGLVLFLLLGIRMSAIVIMEIPVSFMLAFIAMKADGITLNVISMFSMLMVLGMIVDFGIVVSENSYRYMEHGMARFNAIRRGVREVVWPVTVTFLCISAAFAPLMFLSGIFGKFIRSLPIVLIICLAGSWFTAMFMMPAHLSIFARVSAKKRKEIAEAEQANREGDEEAEYESGLFGVLQHKYRALLSLALKHRYLTLGVLILLLGFSLFLFKAAGFIFMPPGGEESMTIVSSLPQGTNLNANLVEAKKIEDIILRLLPKNELDALQSTVGEETSSILDPRPGDATHKSTFKVYISQEKDRKRTAVEINEALRKKILLAQKKGILSDSLEFKFSIDAHGPPVGKPVNVEIRGDDFTVMRKIAAEYTAYLKKVKGIYDLSLDFEKGKEEFRYVINDVMAARTGVSAYDAAMALNASYQGAVATHIRKDKDDINIRVRFPEKERKRLGSLSEVMIGTRRGGLVPLNLVTTLHQRSGIAFINRLNFRRIVQVQANLQTDITTSKKVNELLKKKFKGIEKRYPGYFVKYGGEEETTSDSMNELGSLFQLALMVIFIILAVFFGSLAIPFVVMSAIPFALVGVSFAMVAHGQPMSFAATLGLFSLAGVIVSNTLVLVQFINYERDKGLPLKKALLEGGVIRLRPVLLTSGTTVLALIPTIYGLGGKDYFVAPLGLAFGYGLVFATFITLVLIPCFYHIAEDIKGLFARLLSRFGIEINPAIYSPALPVEEKGPILDSSGNPILRDPLGGKGRGKK